MTELTNIEIEAKLVDIDSYRSETGRIFKKMAKDGQITQEEFEFIKKEGLKEILDQSGIKVV